MPLTLICNKSFEECTFPSKWKSAYVVPIHKNGDKNNIKNYRPISKLNIFGKVLELAVHNILINSVKSLIIPEQHGFFPCRSIDTNLVSYSDHILSAMDCQTQMDSVYTDFSKAFDKINHNILIMKLSEIGIHGDLLRWLTSYLFNRSQIISVNGFISEPYVATSGVPQGSHLGPLLFLIYVNDIGSSFTFCKFLLYADDLKLFAPVSSLADCYCIQNDLDSFHNYCLINKLHLNFDKCVCISFTRNINKFAFDYNLNNIVLKQVLQIKDLGVVFDNKMLFCAHVDYLLSQCNRMLGFVIRTCKQFTLISAMKALYYSFVYSKLNYAAVVWSPQYSHYIDRLEAVQNRFLRFICFRTNGVVHYNTSISDLKTQFNFISLESRRKQMDVIFLYKILNGLADSPYILSKIYFYIPPCNLRYFNLFFETFARTNARKNSPILRIVKTYNDNFSDVDLFFISFDGFKRTIRGTY